LKEGSQKCPFSLIQLILTKLTKPWIWDGFVASFDGPARAIKCALAIEKSLAARGIICRIGLHTGECEVRRGQLHGIALNIAARIAALASPSSVFVSQTVKDLVAGSNLGFADAGMHTLKGLPEEWRLYEVANP